MSWECGECGEMEGRAQVRVDSVCHHCGKPLCQKHRIEILDDAFSSESGAVSGEAFHCDSCKQIYHDRGATKGMRVMT